MISGLYCRKRALLAGAQIIACLVMSLVTIGAQGTANPARARQGEGLDERRAKIFSEVVARPFPNPNCSFGRERDPCVWGKLTYALAALQLGRNEAEIAAANERIREATSRVMGRTSGGESDASEPVPDLEYETHRFHFLTSSLLAQIYEVSRTQKGGEKPRLEPGNKKAIADAFWQYAKGSCKIADAEPSRTWIVWGSENHHLMRATTCWAAALVLTYQEDCATCAYADGSSVAGQLAAWTGFLKEYVRQRSMHGGFMEYFSRTYAKYSLQTLYLIADLSRDARLRELASAMIDVWWTEWSQEQFGGIHAASEARSGDTTDGMSEMGWYYFDLGEARAVRTPALLVMISSHYRPPTQVYTFIHERPHEPPYEVWSRRSGLRAGPSPGPHLTSVDGAVGGILRYTYATSAFVMGTSLTPKLAYERWADFSSQNRWSGLAVNIGRPHAIYARPLVASGQTRDLNATWGIQSRATQIIQKLPRPWSYRTGRMAIFVGDLEARQDGEWFYIETDSAYVAFRPAFGGVEAGRKKGLFLLRDDASPVIFQASTKSEFQTSEEFKRAIKSAHLAVDGNAVHFRGLGGARMISFYYKSDRRPELDGAPVDYRPPAAYSGPILNSQWGGSRIAIGRGSDLLIRDFH